MVRHSNSFNFEPYRKGIVNCDVNAYGSDNCNDTCNGIGSHQHHDVLLHSFFARIQAQLHKSVAI